MKSENTKLKVISVRDGVGESSLTVKRISRPHFLFPQIGWARGIVLYRYVLKGGCAM